jgi:hypothetical protein
MRGKALTLGLCLFVGLAMAGCNDATDGMQVFEATLSSQNEIPPRPTPASGKAQFLWDGTTMRFTVEIDDIQNIVQGHIHIGSATVNGPVRVWLYKLPEKTIGPPVSTSDKVARFEGSFTAADVIAPTTINDLLAAMASGGAYANFHTTAFPGGEMRGQINQVTVN